MRILTAPRSRQVSPSLHFRNGARISLSMNPVAVTVMLSIIVGFLGLLLYGLSTGAVWIVAVLAIVAVALFVRWG